MRFKLSVLFLLCLSATLLPAQQELGLHFLPGVMQSTKTNPAFVPEENFIIGLPSGQFNFFHTSGSINDLLDTSPDTASNLNVNNWINLLEGDNVLNTNVEVETFRIFYRVGKLGLSLNHAAKLNTNFEYSDDYVRLLGEGNAQFAGDTVTFGPRIQMDAYHEVGLGLAYAINDRINLGVRAKYLGGIGNISTDRSRIALYTDDDFYQISIDSDYSLNTTNFISYSDTSFFDLNFPDNYVLTNVFSQNNGFAFDLGIDWQVTKQLSVAASVVDIGKINWKENALTYRSNSKESFEGIAIDFPSVLRGEIAEFSSSIDTIDFNNLFNFEEAPNGYSSTLPTKLYLSANYQINDRFRVGGLYHAEFYQGEQRNAFALNVNAKISKMLSVGGIYAYRFDRLDNLGLNVRFDLGPVQIFASTDNVLAAVRPYSSTNTNGRVGINLVLNRFGKKKAGEETEFME